MQYVARQPILDSHRCLTAFELLFRNSHENRCPPSDPDVASKKTMDTALLVGLDTLSGGHDVFLNCADDLILSGLPTLFPPGITVIEVLESVQPTPSILDACREFKRLGYRIALDDFVPQPGLEPLIELADVIKIDVRSTSPADCAAIASKYLATNHQLLAEKVETKEEFQRAATMGFTRFQGYFFSKPTILSTARIDGLDSNQFRMLRMLGKAQLDLVEVEAVVKSDPALCYRLLRLLNSSVFYFQSEIRSVLHALMLLGEAEVRKWLLLVCAVVGGMKAQKRHLLITALVRARFLELIAPEAQLSRSALFILGMLSLMDALLDVPITAIADQVAVSTEVRSALAGAPSPLRRCLDLALAYEGADWILCEEIRKEWRIPPGVVSRAYVDALGWAKEVSAA